MNIQNWLSSFLLVIALAFPALGQKSIEKVRQFDHVEQFKVQVSDSLFTFESPNQFSAIVIKSTQEQIFQIKLDDSWVIIPKDEDAPTLTYFISLPEVTQKIFLKAYPNSNFDLFAIYSGKTPNIDPKKSRTSLTQDCAEPLEIVPQSEWRSGLQAPNYSRSFHSVSHNIVHHSAGSNASANYTQVVRDIYLYHTQVNGWSDVGYNYLIAQDGTIYAGRDPNGGSQDNVRGAHFCGSNSKTLGVCLLGNYETATPSQSIWSSLQSLLTYQLLNQELDPFESSPHPLGNIGTIAGHRDGCSTLCPGENVYSQLENLRSEVNEMMEFCLNGSSIAFSADREFTKVQELVSFTNESNFYDEYKWIFEGGFPKESSHPSPSVTYTVPGFYDVMLIGLQGITSDTLLKEDLIQVSTFPNQPVLFPNPVSSSSQLTIDSQDDIQKIELYEMSGKLTGQWNGELEIEMPEVKAGVYIMRIQSGSRVFKKKLMIEN